MIQMIKATDMELELVITIRVEMLKVVNCLSEDAVFDKAFFDTTREYFKNAHQTTVLAIDNGEAIGCATICYIYVMPTVDHPSGKRAHIMNVYIRNSHRRQGLAFEMMKMLIEEATQKGVTEISLDATEAGRPLYEKCGFVPAQEGMVLCINPKLSCTH